MKYVVIFLLLFAISSCKKEQDEMVKRCFWKDSTLTYPVILSLKVQTSSGSSNRSGYAFLDKTAPVQVHNCINPYTTSISINKANYCTGYSFRLVAPFYYTPGVWIDKNTVGELNKVEFDASYKKVTFWTKNSTYFNNGNYLILKSGDEHGNYLQEMGEIRKKYSIDPGCGADSTLNTVLYFDNVNGSSITLYSYNNTSKLLFSSTYTLTGVDCTTIEIP